MISIKDVATHAGVAISTVSKVLNNYPYVSEETKAKVRASIHELNYIPNTIAAALSSKQSGRVALLIDMNAQTQAIDEITMQYLSGAITQSLEMNIEIVTFFISMIKHMTPEEITRYLQSQGFDGLLIIGINKDDTYLHELINSKVFYCVVVDAPMYNEKTTCVSIDNYTGQYEVAKKTILENTCKRVLYIAGKRNAYVTDERIRAMHQLKKDLDLTLMIRNGDFSEKKAREIAFRYAENKDIIVCGSDLMAIGAMNALTEMDIFRPVCGFDGVTLMGYVGKQMNTVAQDFASIGANAVIELRRLFEGESGRSVVLPFELARLYYLDIIR